MDLRTAFARLERADLEHLSRQHTSYRYLGDQEALTRALDSFLLYVDTRDRKVVPHLIMDGFWEMWVTTAIARRLQPGWRCADFGDSCGYYAMLMAKLGAEEVLIYDEGVDPDEGDSLIQRSFDVNGAPCSFGGDFGDAVEVAGQIEGDFDLLKVSLETGALEVLATLRTRAARVLLELREEQRTEEFLDTLLQKYVIEEIETDAKFRPVSALGTKGTQWLWMTPR